MQRSHRKVFVLELLERREQPNDMFSLGSSMLLGLDSGFLSDPLSSVLQDATDPSALVAPINPGQGELEGVILASPTDLSRSSLLFAPTAPVADALNETVGAMTTEATLLTGLTGAASNLFGPGPEEGPSIDGPAWMTNAPIPIADGVAQHSVVADGSGIVYQIGGGSGPTLAGTGAVNAYDPATGLWTAKAPVPGAGGIRNFDSAAWVASETGPGKIYLFGGIAGSPATVSDKTLIYDIATDSWSEGAPMPGPRFGSAVSDLGGYVFVVGGGTATVPNNRDFWIYDSFKNTWYTGLPEMLAPTENTCLNGGAAAFRCTFRIHGAMAFFETAPSELAIQWHVFAGGFGGRLHQVLDISTFTWSERPLMPAGATDPGVEATYNFTDGFTQNIYVVGSGDATPIPPGLTQKYNVRTQTWSNGPELPTPTSNTASALSNYFEIYVMGGYNGATTVPNNVSLIAFDS